jgi:hypothetical protein
MSHQLGIHAAVIPTPEWLLQEKVQAKQGLNPQLQCSIPGSDVTQAEHS